MDKEMQTYTKFHYSICSSSKSRQVRLNVELNQDKHDTELVTDYITDRIIRTIYGEDFIGVNDMHTLGTSVNQARIQNIVNLLNFAGIQIITLYNPEDDEHTRNDVEKLDKCINEAKRILGTYELTE